MKCPSIKEQIAAGKSLIIKNNEFRLLSNIKIDDTILILNIQSILTPYKRKMKEYIHTYILNDSDIKDYEYKPEKLCYDIYGTIELTPLILEINNMTSATDFHDIGEGIKLFDSNIIDFLNEIIILEKRTINSNRANITKDIHQ